MSEKTKKWLVPTVVGVVLFAANLMVHKPDAGFGAYEWIVALANAATLAGIVVAGIGGLSWVNAKGMFDIVKYGMSSTIGRFLPFGKKNVFHTGEKYYDYVERKNEEGRTWLKEWLFVGLAVVGLAVVLTVASHFATPTEGAVLQKLVGAVV